MKTKFAEYKVQTIRLHEATTITADQPERIHALWEQYVTKAEWFDAEKEQVVLFTMNAKLRCTGFFLVSMGTINETVVHPREIFKPVIVASAYGFAIAHNHPSGDPTPSEADRRFTRRLREGAELLSLQFLDHVIIGERQQMPGGFFSFRESGLI